MYFNNQNTIFDHRAQGKVFRGFELNCLNLNRAEAAVFADPTYGKEADLIRSILKKYPRNNDPQIVALKICLIDVTNSTHLHQYKCLLQLAESICKLDFDTRINKDHPFDPALVNEIAGATNTNLFSFASKYCHYHRLYLYDKDDYPKFDSIVSYCLPEYINHYAPNYRFFYKNKKHKVTQSFLYYKLRQDKDYSAYNDLIEEALKLAHIPLAHMSRPKTKFDYLMWYANR